MFGPLNFFSLNQLSPIITFRRNASCRLVLDVEAEKVIHTAQATGVKSSNGGHDHAPPHPQGIAV